MHELQRDRLCNGAQEDWFPLLLRVLVVIMLLVVCFVLDVSSFRGKK